MRAYYGKNKQHNCVFNVHGGVKKRRSLLDLIFWTGGRVMQEQESQEEEKIARNTTHALMYSVVASPIEKQMILVSPYINNNYLPTLLQKLVENHITIVDI